MGGGGKLAGNRSHSSTAHCKPSKWGGANATHPCPKLPSDLRFGGCLRNAGAPRLPPRPQSFPVQFCQVQTGRLGEQDGSPDPQCHRPSLGMQSEALPNRPASQTSSSAKHNIPRAIDKDVQSRAGPASLSLAGRDAGGRAVETCKKGSVPRSSSLTLELPKPRLRLGRSVQSLPQPTLP